MHAFSFTPLDTQSTFFCTRMKWPSNEILYIEKFRKKFRKKCRKKWKKIEKKSIKIRNKSQKKFRKCERRASKRRCTRKDGETCPLPRCLRRERAKIKGHIFASRDHSRKSLVYDLDLLNKVNLQKKLNTAITNALFLVTSRLKIQNLVFTLFFSPEYSLEIIIEEGCYQAR